MGPGIDIFNCFGVGIDQYVREVTSILMSSSALSPNLSLEHRAYLIVLDNVVILREQGKEKKFPKKVSRALKTKSRCFAPNGLSFCELH